MAWKYKHEKLLEHKEYIIRQYKNNVPIKLIASEQDLSVSSIDRHLKAWGVGARKGIKYLLGKAILEGNRL